MTEESFILVSLKEKKSKALAQTITNDTCRVILEFLSSKGEDEFATESILAKNLSVPLSTVHYNMKALVKAGLVTKDEFHYSPKGKEVPHYKLANKFIIIAPKDSENIRSKLKRFWPVSVVAVAFIGVMSFLIKFIKTGSSNGGVLSASLDKVGVAESGDLAVRSLGVASQESAKIASDVASPIASSAAAQFSSTPQIASNVHIFLGVDFSWFFSSDFVWFLTGFLIASFILVISFFVFFRKK